MREGGEALGEEGDVLLGSSAAAQGRLPARVALKELDEGLRSPLELVEVVGDDELLFAADDAGPLRVPAGGEEPRNDRVRRAVFGGHDERRAALDYFPVRERTPRRDPGG